MLKFLISILICLYISFGEEWTFTDTLHLSKNATGDETGIDSANAISTIAGLTTYMNGKSFTGNERLLILQWGEELEGAGTLGGWTVENNPANIPVWRVHPDWKHAAIWDRTKAGVRAVAATPYRTLYLTQAMHFDGLLVENYNNGTSLNDRMCIRFDAAACSNSVVINCLFVDTATTGTGRLAVTGGVTSKNITIANNIFYGFNTAITLSAGNNAVYNNTIINPRTLGVSVGYYGTKFTNNIIWGYSQDIATDYMIGSTNNALYVGSPTCQYCISIIGIPLDSLFVDPNNYNYNVNTTAHHLVGLGANLSTDTRYAFSTDINGASRGDLWSIGADECTECIDTAPTRIFVDSMLDVDLVGYTYNPNQIVNYAGGMYRAFRNPQGALDVVQPGDTIMLRGYKYKSTDVPDSMFTLKISGNTENWITMMSFPGDENIAVLDGDNNVKAGSVYSIIGSLTAVTHYGFERIWVKNGATPDGTCARGFHGGEGPFSFRYCVFTDILATSGSSVPSALSIHRPTNVLIEYCYFHNNGSETRIEYNPAHILFYGDYNESVVARDGFTYLGDGQHAAKNVVRYNYFGKGNVGIMDAKENQYFCGRNADGNGYDMSYKEYSDEIYYNVFDSLLSTAILSNMDFVQIHNNAILNCYGGITVGYNESYNYRPMIYNNTLKNVSNVGIAVKQWHDYPTGSEFNSEPDYYVYVINNITDSCTQTSTNSLEEYTIQVDTTDFIVDGVTVDNQDSAYLQNNYSYRPSKHSNDPTGTLVWYIRYLRKTIADLSSKYLFKHFRNDYDTDNQLWQSDTGYRQLIPRVEHTINGDTLAINAGIGGAHPYLSGVTLPTYIGASSGSDTTTIKNVYNVQKLATAEAADWVPDIESPLIAIDSIRPATWYPGKRLTIYGKNLTSGMSMSFGDSSLNTYEYISETMVIDTIPPGMPSGTYQIGIGGTQLGNTVRVFRPRWGW